MNTQVSKELNFRKNQSAIAMMVAYVSWTMLFATLFLGYSVYRFSVSTWPPIGFERISLLWPIISTVIIGLSSASFYAARVKYINGKREQFRVFLTLTLVLGFMFLGAQWLLWSKLTLMGLYVSAGIFPSILHGFTWIHAAHIVCALVAAFYLYFISTEKAFQTNREILVGNVENFWHFLSIIWLIMFIFLFVV